jgi:RNA polymerase nonessential primary-like sigma factor
MPKYLTAEEERQLAKKALKGDHDARNRIIIGMLPMIYRDAFRIANKSQAEPEDLVNLAVAHVCKAFHGFKPEYGYRASTYFLRGLRTVMWQHARQSLIQTPKHGAKESGKEDEQRARETTSLNTVIGYTGGGLRLHIELGGVIPDHREACPTENAARTERVQKVREAIGKLRRRTKEVIELRMTGVTLREIAKRLRLSKQRVQQIERDGHEELRKMVDVLAERKTRRQRHHPETLAPAG